MHDPCLQNERWPILADEFANISKVSTYISFRLCSAAFCRLLAARCVCIGEANLLFVEVLRRDISIPAREDVLYVL
jgi:hypothetical protein